MSSTSKEKRIQVRENARIFKEITRLCLRCPDSNTASTCRAHLPDNDNMSSCTSHSTTEDLWPGFRADPESTHDCPVDLKNLNACHDLLRSAVREDATAFTNVKKGTKSLHGDSGAFKNLRSERANLSCTVNGVTFTLTKEILGAAHKTAHPINYPDVENLNLSKADGKKPVRSSASGSGRGNKENKGKLKYVKKPQRTATFASSDKLITNHFPITFNSEQILYEYQVNGLQSRDPTKTLSSPKKNTIIRRLIEMDLTLQEHQSSFSHNNEGKIISWIPLHPAGVPEGTIFINNTAVPDFDRTSNGIPSHQFSLNVSFQRKFDFQGLDDFVKCFDSDYQEVGASQALDIMFGNNIARNHQGTTVQIGDNRFFPIGDKKNEFELNAGLVALRGFSSHITPVDGSVTLNVNTAFSAFYKPQTVQNYINALDRKGAQQLLLHVRVRIMYDRCKPGEADSSKDTEARRTKTITGFSSKIAEDIKFQDRNNKEVSVWSHFEKTYPNATSNGQLQICVNTGDSTPGNECWFLADQLMVLPGQLYSGFLEPDLTAKMIEFACQSPEANRTSIMESGLKALGLHKGTPPLLSKAGITFKPDMMTIPFRQIPHPRVSYRGKSAEIKDGAWTTLKQQFHTTNRQIDGPAVFFSLQGAGNSHMETQYIACFKKMYGANGIAFKSRGDAVHDQFKRLRDFSSATLVDAIKRVGLAILVLPDDSPDERKNYAAFRVAADQVVGKPSLVLSEKRMLELIGKRFQPGDVVQSLVPYMAQNMMKINTRLGNENHRVEAFTGIKGTLVLGADLVHPKQSNPTDVPSIASLVGSTVEPSMRCLAKAWHCLLLQSPSSYYIARYASYDVNTRGRTVLY